MRDERLARHRHLRAVRPQVVRPRARPWRKVLVGSLLGAALAGAGLLFVFSEPAPRPETVPLVVGRVEMALESDAYVVRKEQIYRAPAAGRVQRLVGEGQRVRVGAPVLRIVTGGASNAEEPPAGEPPAGDLFDEAGESGTQHAFDLLGDQIYELSVAWTVARDRGDAAEMKRIQADLDNLAVRQAELVRDAGRQAPRPRQPTSAPRHLSVTEVQAANAGVLVYQTDGLEQALAPGADSQWTPSWLRGLPLPDIKTVGEGEVEAGAPLFKVVDNLSLSLLAVVPADTILPADGRVELRISGLEGRTVLARANRMGVEGGEVLLHLTAPLFPEELTAVRRVRASVLLAAYSGLVAPRSSVDVQNGQEGVWVEDGAQFRFQPVRILGGNDKEVALETDLPRDAHIARVPPRAIR